MSRYKRDDRGHICPDENGVWVYHKQPNGDVYGYDFGPNIIMVNGVRVNWGYTLRGDFAPMKNVSESCRNWVYSLTSEQKEFICEIIEAVGNDRTHTEPVHR